MKTNLSKISEMVFARLEKYSDDTDIDGRDIMNTAHQSLARVLRKRYFENKQFDTAYMDGGLLFTFKDREVKKDEDRDEFYIEIPAATVDLPFGKGIKRVCDAEDRSLTYRFLPENFEEMFRGLRSVLLEGYRGCYQENDRLYLYNVDADEVPETLMLTMTAPLDGIDSRDTINIPQDILEQVVELCVQKWTQAATTPTDEHNDNVDQR